jgi:hypothetical protein
MNPWIVDIILVLWNVKPYLITAELVRRLWTQRNKVGLKPPKAFAETVQSVLNHHTSQSDVWVKNGSGGGENRCLAFPQWVSALGNGTPILRWDRNAWEPSPAFRICFGAEEKTLPLPQHDETRASLRRGFFCTEKGALNSSSRRPQSLEFFRSQRFCF